MSRTEGGKDEDKDWARQRKGAELCGGLDIGKSHGHGDPKGGQLLLGRKGEGTERVKRPEGAPGLHHGKVITPLHGPFSLPLEAVKKFQNPRGYTGLF